MDQSPQHRAHWQCQQVVGRRDARIERRDCPRRDGECGLPTWSGTRPAPRRRRCCARRSELAAIERYFPEYPRVIGAIVAEE